MKAKNIDRLKRTLNEIAKANVKLTLVRAKVVAVDWDAKTMRVTSLVDGLDYFDILLGFGSFYQKPKLNTTCLIGIYDKHTTAGFLLDAAEIEEGVFTSGKTMFTIKEDGFIINQNNESLITILNDMIDELNKIIVLQGTTINVAAMTAIKQRLNKVLIA